MATTGIGSSGSDFTGLYDVLKMRYEPVLQDLLVSDSELHDLFMEVEGMAVEEGPDGQRINISHLFSGGGGAGFATGEDAYIPNPALPSSKQSYVNLSTLFGSVEVSGKTMRRLKQGPAAVADWADVTLPNVVRKVTHHKDRALAGTGTGIIARVNEGSPDTSLVIDSAFGIAGLTGATKLFMEGDTIRLSPNANGTSPRTNAAVVGSILHGTNILNIDALPASGADNDYIFLGDGNITAAPVEIMGLHGHIDDGTVVATYQSLSRSTYPKLQSQVVDASAAPFSQALTEDLIISAATKTWEYGGGKPDVLVGGYSAVTSFWKSMKGDRVFNDPRGQFTGGTDLKSGLKVIVGMQELVLRPVRKLPPEVAFLIQKDTLKMYVNERGRWDDTDGSVWNRVVNSTGRRDAFFGVYLCELATAGFAPLKNCRINNLAAV